MPRESPNEFADVVLCGTLSPGPSSSDIWPAVGGNLGPSVNWTTLVVGMLRKERMGGAGGKGVSTHCCGSDAQPDSAPFFWLLV